MNQNASPLADPFLQRKKLIFLRERSECNKLLIQGESRLSYQTDNSFLIDKINSLIKENKKNEIIQTQKMLRSLKGKDLLNFRKSNGKGDILIKYILESILHCFWY